MSSIEKCPLPEEALLLSYCKAGHYTDCYTTVVPGCISHAEFVTAFYTTRLFNLERILLRWFVSKPSTDTDAQQLADGSLNAFAAWTVEERSENQLLMSDFRGRTRSWLMISPLIVEGAIHTRLYFGSAVVANKDPNSGVTSMGLVFRALLGFHKVYSRALLYTAKLRL